MHPKPFHHGHQHKPPHAPFAASKVLNFVDESRLDILLAPLVPDAADRAFVLRCVVGEGPLHHRGANYILLTLLAQAAVPGRSAPARPPTAGVAVPMRLPPYLTESVDEGTYPLLLPTGVLLDLAGGDQNRLAAMIDCLTDGPSQHALANVIMVALIERLLPSTQP